MRDRERERERERERKKEKYTRPAHNLTHRNLTPFCWKNKYMSNTVVAGPRTMYFK